MTTDPLYDLLSPHLDNAPPRSDDLTTKYLSHLSTLSLDAITTSEPQTLAQASHSNLRSIQSLAARSNASIVASSTHLSTLGTSIPDFCSAAKELKDAVPALDRRTLAFSEKYSRIRDRDHEHEKHGSSINGSAQNTTLDRRKRALLLSRNVDRLSSILDLPSLLSSTISAAASQSTTAGSAYYASALDLRSHIRRLHMLHGKESKLVRGIYEQCEEKMKDMVSDLIRSLRGREVKLVAGMRVIGLLRRVLPDLEAAGSGAGGGGQEGLFGALFLVCRLSTLVNMLSALEPLKDLADQETAARNEERQQKGSKSAETNGYSQRNGPSAWATGQQTEQYLKRYIEIFREQSFAIVSMYKSIFPASTASSTTSTLPSYPKASQHPPSQPPSADQRNQDNNILFAPPSALSTFPLHLVSLLTDTLREYLPNIRDRSSRESLLTQVLYCAGSLGRLGGDFSLVIAQLEMDSQDQDEEGPGEKESGNQKGVGEDDDQGLAEDSSEQESEETSAANAREKNRVIDGARREEWVEVMKKHRELAGRLELLASGVGLGANRTMSTPAGGMTEFRSKA